MIQNPILADQKSKNSSSNFGIKIRVNNTCRPSKNIGSERERERRSTVYRQSGIYPNMNYDPHPPDIAISHLEKYFNKGVRFFFTIYYPWLLLGMNVLLPLKS